MYTINEENQNLNFLATLNQVGVDISQPSKIGEFLATCDRAALEHFFPKMLEQFIVKGAVRTLSADIAKLAKVGTEEYKAVVEGTFIAWDSGFMTVAAKKRALRVPTTKKGSRSTTAFTQAAILTEAQQVRKSGKSEAAKREQSDLELLASYGTEKWDKLLIVLLDKPDYIISRAITSLTQAAKLEREAALKAATDSIENELNLG